MKELVDAIAQQLIPFLQRRLYGAHLDRVRGLRSPSEKLIYLYLLLAQPQSFTTTRRALSLGERTVDRSLRRLLEKECIILDDRYLYTLAPTHNESLI
ncbi:MAG: hypothetical protein V1924_01590 [Candidatus Bathyarchaeota archaeon]